MAKFVHISFSFRGAPKIEELLPAFNQALDWVRYAPNCWIVWTTSSTEKWFARLKPHLTDDDHMLIATLDLQDYNGWLPQWVWDWITKER